MNWDTPIFSHAVCCKRWWIFTNALQPRVSCYSGRNRFAKGQSYVWKGFHDGTRSGPVHEVRCLEIILFSKLVVFRIFTEMESLTAP